MSALMISQVSVTDPADFQAYLQKSKALASQYGAELVTRGALHHALTEPGTAHDLVVIARFPSMEKLQAWHESDAYKDLIPLRKSGSDQIMHAYEELPAPGGDAQ